MLDCFFILLDVCKKSEKEFVELGGYKFKESQNWVVATADL